MISICTATRKRPFEYRRLAESVLDNAKTPEDIEFVTYRDDDDTTQYQYVGNYKEVIGPRILYAKMWNECAEVASGDIYMQVPDDFVFETKDWDLLVYHAFDQYPDKIVLAFPYDGIEHHKGFGTTFFLHKNWIDTVGYFVPPYFSGYFIDNWLNNVATVLNRKYQLEMMVRHLWVEHDETHQEYIARTKKDDSRKMFFDLRPKRVLDIKKLQRFIDEKRTDLCPPIETI